MSQVRIPAQHFFLKNLEAFSEKWKWKIITGRFFSAASIGPRPETVSAPIHQNRNRTQKAEWMKAKPILFFSPTAAGDLPGRLGSVVADICLLKHWSWVRLFSLLPRAINDALWILILLIMYISPELILPRHDFCCLWIILKIKCALSHNKFIGIRHYLNFFKDIERFLYFIRISHLKEHESLVLVSWPL